MMKIRRFLTALAAGAAMLLVSLPEGHPGTPAIAADAALAGQASPSSLTFGSSSSDAQTFTVTGTAANGRLTAVSSDEKVATVSSIPSAPGATGSQTFKVSPAGPGSATVTVSDPAGAKLVVTITVMADSGKLSGSSVPVIAGVGIVVAIVALIGIHHNGNQVVAATGTAPPILTPTLTPTPTPAPTKSAAPTPTPALTGSPAPTSTPTPLPTPLPSGVTASPTTSPSPSPSSAATASASPTPTPAPTLTAGPLMVTPGEIDFVVGSGTTTGTFTATETGYVGVFTITDGNTAVATVSPGSGSGPSQQFTVTETGVGSTVITVADSNGNKAQVTIYVTQTNATVNARGRHTTAPLTSPRRTTR